MNSLKALLPEGITHYLTGVNTGPLIDLLVFENTITIQEHNRFTSFSLPLDATKSTPDILVFTTKPSGILSYFKYHIEIMIDISKTSPIFAIRSGFPILWMFSETYILKLLKN